MATKYFKLGTIGKYFNDSQLGIYLSRVNAFGIDETYLDYRLKNFIQTGYLVEITKLEYDNLRIAGKNASNMPDVVVDIGQNLYIDPVEAITAIPPSQPSLGSRYIVYKENPRPPWQGKKDLIAVWNGINWDYITPVNGNVCPVYAWGTAVEYIGTYPSGYWDYTEQMIELITDEDDSIDFIPAPPVDPDFYMNLLIQERNQRIEADNAIWKFLENAPIASHTHTADLINITDSQNYYQGTTVESALQEIGSSLVDLYSRIDYLQEQIDNLAPGINTRTYESYDSAYFYVEHDLGKIPAGLRVYDINAGTYIWVLPSILSEFFVEFSLAKPRDITVTIY